MAPNPLLEHKAHGTTASLQDNDTDNISNTGLGMSWRRHRLDWTRGFGLLAGQYRGLGLHINLHLNNLDSKPRTKSRLPRSPGGGHAYGEYDQPPPVSPGQGSGYGAGPVAGGFLNPIYQPNQVYVPPSYIQPIPLYPQPQLPIYPQQHQPAIFPQHSFNTEQSLKSGTNAAEVNDKEPNPEDVKEALVEKGNENENLKPEVKKKPKLKGKLWHVGQLMLLDIKMHSILF